MGCCSSTTKECGNSKSPPPLQQDDEEETVKQVLSETKSADGKTRHHQNGAFFNKRFVAMASESATTASPATAENKGDELRVTRRRSEQSTGQNRPGYDWRTDTGESSGRISRFPVMYSDSWSWERGIDGGQSSRKTGGSLERVGSGLGERIRKVDDEKDTWAPTSNELLEDPLMSLECFIFL